MVSHTIPFTEDDLDYVLDPPNPRQVLRIAIRLKELIDKIVPVEFEQSLVTKADSVIITSKVVELAKRAAGGKGNGERGTSSSRYRACLPFALLTVSRWYEEIGVSELYDAGLYSCRSLAAQYIAKKLIEEWDEKDEKYLFINVLCQKFRIMLNNKVSSPANTLEVAIDAHSTMIICSTGYQRCMKWLWRGWIVQAENEPEKFVLYKGAGNCHFVAHFDPERIKTPMYQNILLILFSFIYLFLFTMATSFAAPEKGLACGWEVLFYIFTFAFILDELIKFYHVGIQYIGFWSAFNDSMYTIVCVSCVLRILASTKTDPTSIEHLNHRAFKILVCVSPMMWIRLLLYLDSERFFGALLVVVKEMMRESIVFFVLLVVVAIGFLQALLGLDAADGLREVTLLVIDNMLQTVMGGGDFDAFNRFEPPYAKILYYFFSFLVSVILLNILIALYNSAYQKIYDNSDSEYLALVSQTTLRFIRAPDEHVYVPPLNIFESLIMPFRLFLSDSAFDTLNHYVMLVLYSPALLIISIYECREARRVSYNRLRGALDDDNETDNEWDLEDGFTYGGLFDSTDGLAVNEAVVQELRLQNQAEAMDPEFLINADLWHSKIDEVAPKVQEAEETNSSWELYPLHKKIDALTEMVQSLVEENRKLKESVSKLTTK